MLRYIVKRTIQAIPLIFGITLLTYMLMTAAPGGPIGAMNFPPRTPPQERAALAARLGVNDPWPVQYLRWLLGDDWMRWDSDGDGIADQSFLLALDADGDGEPEPPGIRHGALRGDFGDSFVSRRPVLQILTERLPATLELGISSLMIGVVVGIVVGIIAAVRRGGLFDNAMRIMAVVFDAIPSFWLGLMLILLFGAQLQLLPLQGRCKATISDSCPPIYERLSYMILPTFILATGLVAGYSRFTRASMLDIINQDYIRTARAKGLSNRMVWFKHAARNALIPIATFLGPAITGILGGAVITETIFSWPGVGRSIVLAVTQRDYPVVMAVTIYAALATIFGYLLSDILYGIIDPRIRYD
ncbi:MAG: ABC transporter permease [Chloroflexota bacterium]